MWGEILKGLLKEGKVLLDTMLTESERKVKQLNNTNNRGRGGEEREQQSECTVTANR